jgi:hypothetical protein
MDLTRDLGLNRPSEEHGLGEKAIQRRDFLKIAAMAAAAAAAAGLPPAAHAAPTKTKMDTPTITCVSGVDNDVNIYVQVCAGATGAPAGFSIQWMTRAAFAANNNQFYLSDDPRLCKASFSGNANGSIYNLAPNACSTVKIGDNLFDNAGASSNCASTPLECNTEYVFQAFAHANSTLQRSSFTSPLTCKTDPCTGSGGGCTFTQGYWKTRGPTNTDSTVGVICDCTSGGNSNVWPAAVMTNGLVLGTVPYTAFQLCSIFNTPAGGNGLISLAHQLIAAKLNIASGADGSSVAGAIASADAQIGSLVVPPVGAGFLSPGSTSALTGALTTYNEGTTGPGHCP